jgi:hypothetical protein
MRPLFEAGKYGEAVDRGLELIEAHPRQPDLYYNVACCESLAGRTADAIEHLRTAVELWDGCREWATQDSDFDPIRDEPAFEALVTAGAPKRRGHRRGTTSEGARSETGEPATSATELQ